MKESISGAQSSWQPASRGIFQGSVLGSVLLNVLINHLCDGSECTLSTIVGEYLVMLEDLGRLQKSLAGTLWSSKASAKSRICDRITPRDKTGWTLTRQKATFAEKHLLGGAQ